MDTTRGKVEIGAISAPDFVDLRAGSTHADLAVCTDASFSLRNNDAAVQLRGAHISSNLFRVLGVAPMLGRTPTMDEELPKRGREVVLGYDSVATSVQR